MRFTGEWEGGIIFSSCFTNQKHHPDQFFFPLLEHPQHPEEIFRDSSIIPIDMDILYLYIHQIGKRHAKKKRCERNDDWLRGKFSGARFLRYCKGY